MSEAVRLLGVYTAGRFDIWALAGSSKASCRAHVMSALLGRRAVQRESGVTALRSEFYRRLEIEGSCEAVRERNFISKCRELVSMEVGARSCLV